MYQTDEILFETDEHKIRYEIVVRHVQRVHSQRHKKPTPGNDYILLF